MTLNIKEKLKSRIIYILKHYIILFIICGFISFNPHELLSAQKKSVTSLTSKSKSTKKNRIRSRRYKRRSYNPSQTRANALLMIRRYSETVCELAGLEPLYGDSTFVYNDLEDSEDIDAIGEDIEYCEVQLEQGKQIVEDEEDSIVEETNLKIDIDTFKALWLSYVDSGESDEFTKGGIHKKTLMGVIIDWLGTPYRFGGTTRRAVDCSAFVQRIFTEVSDLTLPRTARIQISVGAEINQDDLEFGDLLFFHTYSYRYASHVGIYLGDGLFAHSSSKYGVTVSSLNARYYSTHLIGARRLYLNDLEQYVNKTAFSSSE
ncbi:MAG: C40 family peptidase [bacterium]